MNPITSITLPAETVTAALEVWLNEYIFQSSVRITSVESDGEVYSLALEQLPSGVVQGRVTATPDDWDLLKDIPVYRWNGNAPAAEPAYLQPANPGEPQLAQPVVQEPAPLTAVAPKRPRQRRRITDEIRQQVAFLSGLGNGPNAIAAELDLGVSTVSRILGEVRKAARQASEDEQATFGGA